jgi:feruloyl esterase
MKWRHEVIVAWVCPMLLVFHAPPASAAASCERLSSLSLPNAKITAAQTVAAGEFMSPAGRGRGTAATADTPGAAGVPAEAAAPAAGAVSGRAGAGVRASFKDTPAFCRVTLTLTPSSDSDIAMEVWLPESEWNGKFQASSAAGWAGSINYGAMRDAMKRGYAVSSNDSGHTGGRGVFALGHPEKVVDFAWRAEHEMAVQAKAIIAAFYGNGPKYSYWEGCSTAGRMALTEAQRFPDDFNGIVAGAPANFTSHQIAQQVWVGQAAHKSDASLIPPGKFAFVHDAVIAACDALDGVKDGVLEDPRRCAFDPKLLECHGDDGPACLTTAQVETAKRIYGGATNSRTGQLIFPGLAKGSELGWAQLAGAQTQAFSREMFQNIVFKDVNWDYKELGFDADVVTAEKTYGGILDAVDSNLRPFFSRGGKLIQYHGWSDPSIAPENSINYYNSVANALGGAKIVGDSYRLFMVPGMAHCTGGEGTSAFDMLRAIEQWVEQGRAPAEIAASRVVNGVVNRTRPLCPFPQTATYKGLGSTDETANFECKAR